MFEKLFYKQIKNNTGWKFVSKSNIILYHIKIRFRLWKRHKFHWYQMDNSPPITVDLTKLKQCDCASMGNRTYNKYYDKEN